MQISIGFSSRIIQRLSHHWHNLPKTRNLSWMIRLKEHFQCWSNVFTSMQIFVYVDLSKSFCLETNASDFVLIRSMLIWYRKHRWLYPISFCSWKFSTIEINYKIYDKEFWLSWMLLKNDSSIGRDSTYLSRYTQTTRTLNTSWYLQIISGHKCKSLSIFL